jgi:hypothetical protein
MAAVKKEKSSWLYWWIALGIAAAVGAGILAALFLK